MKPRLLSLMIVFLAWGCVAPASAVATQVDEYAQARKQFVSAERALKQGQRKKFARLTKPLRDYPLYPYLRYQDIKSRLRSVKETEIAGFLKRFDDTPLAPQLRRIWLRRLAARKRWADFVRFFAAAPSRSTSLQCTYARALMATGKPAPASLVRELWLVGKSQPDECDPVFKHALAKGLITPTLVWGRVELAVRGGKPKLAGYLARFLPKADRPWVTKWLRVRRAPGRILLSDAFASPHPMRERMLTYGVARLARRDPVAASEVWETLRDRYTFSAPNRYRVQRAIALGYATDDLPGAETLLARLDADGSDKRIRQTRILLAMRTNNWSRVALLTEPLLDSDSSRWRYWHARALGQIGRTEAAEELLTSLAGERSYYGFLAADRTELPYNINPEEMDVALDIVTGVREQPGIRRAFELYRLGRLAPAQREWRVATRHMSRRELAAAGQLASDLDWHHQAIFTVARARCYNDLNLRFPTTYASKVEALTRQRGLDPAWVFAIMRQESAFNPRARSRAGALGLMQIMPATGRHIAKSLRHSQVGGVKLLNTDTNLRFGTHYLNVLLKRLGQQRVLATAAYNAGPHRVRRWLPTGEDMAGDLWVELVPFKETRRYIRRVLAYTAIYEVLFGQDPTSISTILATVQPRDKQPANARITAPAAAQSVADDGLKPSAALAVNHRPKHPIH